MSSFILIISVLILTIFSENLKKRINRFFFLTVLLIFMALVADFLVELIIGQTSPVINIAIRVLDVFSYSSAGLQIITFAFYLYEYMSTKASVSKKPFYLMAMIGALNVLLAMIASHMNLYVLFDANNNYIRQDTFWISDVLPTLALLIFAGTIIYYIKLFKVREWLTLLIYSVLPIVLYIFEIVFSGFYLAGIGIAFTLYLVYVNLQVELRMQLKAQEMELAEARISVMLSQIQPHFLYNSLVSIEYLCEIDGAKRAVSALQDFSAYLRGNMDSLTQKKPIPFQQELLHTNLYLSLEKRRFGNRIQAEYDTPITDFLLPALSLQPIAENAVRHGIVKRDEGGKIILRTFEDEACWYITVTDNGVGFDTQKSIHDGRHHVGIENVRSRLKAMCGGTLEITSIPGTGTTVTISIPKQEVRTDEYTSSR